MALPIITDVIRAAVEGHTAAGGRWANVYHFRKTPVLSNTGAIAIADARLVALYNTNLGTGSAWKAFCTAGVGVEQFRFTPLDGLSASVINTHVIPGVATGTSLPANCAIVTSFHTALRGRSYRGRSYWGPIAENQVATNGTIGAAVVSGISDQFTAWLASLAGTGITLVVASYTHSTAEDVTTATVNSRFDSQRRRLGA